MLEIEAGGGFEELKDCKGPNEDDGELFEGPEENGDVLLIDAKGGGDSTALTGFGNIGAGLGVSRRVIFFLIVGMGGGNIEDWFGGGTLTNPAGGPFVSPGGGRVKSSLTDPCSGVIPLVAFRNTPLGGAFLSPNFCLSLSLKFGFNLGLCCSSNGISFVKLLDSDLVASI